MATRTSLAVPDELVYGLVMSRMLRYTAGPLTPTSRAWCWQLKRFAEDRASCMPDAIPAPAPWDLAEWGKL